MENVTNFMLEYFRAKIADEQRYQEIRVPFRRKFFTNDCGYDSHAHTLRRLESEKVISVEKMGSCVEVITEQILHYSGGEQSVRLKYRLTNHGDGWLIAIVQTACFACGGTGDSSCAVCKGEKWLSKEAPIKAVGQQ
jgi:hypothetical protein